jgi:POT family proton-dependent oligopeptide transporter
MPDATTAPAPAGGAMPRQIPFIIGNEACERFSFYGMRNILTPFLMGSLLLHAPEAERAPLAKEVFHSFVIGVYFFPLLGGWLSDRLTGKYRSILWFSLLYCLGPACLVAFHDSVPGFYLGLFLIALGSGGIKPLVSTFVGDQFDQSNKDKAKLVYDVFYWTINFGSFFASLLLPRLLKAWGPAWAFGVPGVLMFLATAIFWWGRRRYVIIPPAPRDPDGFLPVAVSALRSRGPGGPGLLLAALGVALGLASLLLIGQLGVVVVICMALGSLLLFGGLGTALQLEGARAHHPAAAVDAVGAVLRVLVVFAILTPFWSLFDQKASTWVLQGGQMRMLAADSWLGFVVKEPAQMQALNPAMVMLLIPFNNLVLYPGLRRLGVEPTPLRRMGFGIGLSGVAWLAAGAIQLTIDGGQQPSIAWQVLPYALLTLGEVLVSATGLEFAYSQSPASMKGVIMSFWLLAVTFGNLWVLITNAAVRNAGVTALIGGSGLSQNAFLIFFFAAFAFVAALAFAAYARRYPMQDHYRSR